MTDATMAATADQTPAAHPLARLTLRRRIVGTIAILSAIGLLAAGLAALLVERNRIVDEVAISLHREISEFRELAQNGVDPDTGAPFVDADRLITVSMQRNIPDTNETQIGYVAGATIVTDGQSSLHREEAFREQVTAHTTTEYGRYESPQYGEVLYAVLPIEKADQVSHYVVAHHLHSEFGKLNDTIRVYGVAALIAWLGMVLAGWMMARRILAPMEELSTTAELITETDLNRRLTITSNDELGAMGTTFNRMLDRLQAALGAQRRMLDDAGHELRTPITVIRGHLELMDPSDPADVDATRFLAIDELDRMNLLVQDLILLAKSQRPDFLTREPVDLHLLVEDVRDKASALGDRDWLVDPSEPITAVADSRRLTQALLQLASNAYKVTGPGDVIAFGCSSSSQSIQLWVRDSGPGVPVADRARIFGRFQSGTGVSAGGTGLGLAIVRAIAEAHDGTASVTAATSAGGARFIIELPLRTPADPSAPTVVLTGERSTLDLHPSVDSQANDTQPRDRVRRDPSAELPLADQVLGSRKEIP